MMTAPPSHDHRGQPASRLATVFFVGAAAALGLPVVLFGVVLGLVGGGPVIGLLVGVVAGAIVAGGAVIPARRGAEARVLSLLDVRRADPVAQARLVNLVEGLCTAGGVARPGLFVLHDAAPNALSLGRDDRHGCLVVTSGLLDTLNRIELEGVLAHELTHLRAGDTAGPTVGVALCGRLAVGALEPLASRLATLSARPEREAKADLDAVALTRYPPGLLSALERIRDSDTELAGVPAALDALWLAPRQRPARQTALEARISALREL
jgi:heat shock protein HtpX